MKKHVFFHRILVLIISVSMIFALTSCSPQKKPVPKPKDKKEENKPPKELDDLSKAIEKIEKSLMEMHESSKKPLFMQLEEIQKKAKKQGGQEQQSKQDGGGSSGGGSGGGSSSGGSSGGQQGSQGGKSSEMDIVTPEAQKMEAALELQKMKQEIEKANRTQFEQLKKDTMKLHSLWNAYESKAVALIMTQTTIKDFEDSLNALTKSINNENVFQSLFDVTQLYKYLPDFYLTYTAESPPEIGKIKFAVKKIQLLSENKDYKGAKEVLEYLKGVWMQTRPKLNEKSKDMINQIEFATSDLSDAIEAQNDTIIKAKAEIILKVSEKLEKANGKKEAKK